MNICFVYVDLSTFVKRDLEILRKHFNVKPVKWTTFWDFKMILSLIRAILTSDLCFIWFADFHTAFTVLLSKIFRKKSIIVTGGYDVLKMPEINYGIRLRWNRHYASFALKNADICLAFSKSSEEDLKKWIRNARAKTVYLGGIDLKKFSCYTKKDDKLVITVAKVTWSNVLRKGLKTFVECAKYLPEVKFVLVGKVLDDSIEYLKKLASGNVEFVGDEKLLDYYQKAKVYVQVSAHEGFGVALAEAMACECIPVVTNRGAIPEVVGDVGYYVPYEDSKATAEAIKEALNADKGKEARERIKKMFPIERREKELVEIIKGLIKEGK